ncbi:hypothetical protein BEL04_19200 [Mucilaginibacter sp. PPCGB 2223]|uniref:hypothetical protein n=1 Tax=Mucilaginibacter sp. PPCGB 2223 TaxID=1886027 RepID=UPI000826F1A8|nr:hypothetical protein [Mucilaginibacter sp. PPCGB 2223]OCX50856.1 hypothetical protein BEL04_19200 [Mucilaginibacter sp. PPCGB 2223]
MKAPKEASATLQSQHVTSTGKNTRSMPAVPVLQARFQPEYDGQEETSSTDISAQSAHTHPAVFGPPVQQKQNGSNVGNAVASFPAIAGPIVQRVLRIDGEQVTESRINNKGAFKTKLNSHISNAAGEAGIASNKVRTRLTQWANDKLAHDYESKADAAWGAANDIVSNDGIPAIKSTDYTVIRILDSGSTKPQHVKFNDTRQEKVIKFGKDDGHLRTEILANKLYTAANIPTLKVDIVTVDGQLAQMTDFVSSFSTPEQLELSSSDDFLRHCGADMLFANWDLFKTDNWMKIDGRMIRSDNGGSLDRSAQGHMKDPGDWNGKAVKDIGSMREKKNSPYSSVTDHEVADSVRTLAKNLTVDKINQAFKDARYPLKQRATMRQTLLDRMKIALAWADKVYPLDKVVNVQHSTEERVREVIEDDDLPMDHAQALIDMGYHGVVPGMPPEFLGEQLKNGMIKPREPQGKTGNPHEMLPKVGPEELLRKDQFGGGLAKAMPKYFDRMKAGRLVRRMSDGERGAFEKAAGEKDMEKVLELIFPEAGKPGARGEMVWSVNKPYVFEREIAKLKGEDYKGTETEHRPEDYHWIMEIYITQEMLDFLADYAYINNPTGGAKPSAFLGNPTLKMEGQSGGVHDKGGIPNIVIKKDGFAKLWKGIQSFHFVEAEDHLWRHSSDNTELIKAKKEKEWKDEQERVKEQRKKDRKEAADKPVDNDNFGKLFGWGEEE